MWSNVITGGNRGGRRKPALFGKVKLGSTPSLPYTEPEPKLSHRGE